MKLKDLEKIKLLETALMVGVPLALIALTKNSEMEETVQIYENWYQKMTPSIDPSVSIAILLSSIPRLADNMLTYRIEPTTSEYKEIKKLYDNIITNLANFLKEQNITDPVEIFAIYEFMYRNGYLSFNHNFNYDIDMKDLSKLNGADVVRGIGVCRSISSMLTDLYKEMGYNSCNLVVSANAKILENADRIGNYPKFKTSEKTKTFVKIVGKTTEFTNTPNHLITMCEKDGKVYVFDPTNDVFLKKGKGNNLVLPNEKSGKMTISYFQNFVSRIKGYFSNTYSNFKIREELKLPTVSQEEYISSYKNVLNYAKNNIEIFDDYYKNNRDMYEELYEILNNQHDMIRRLSPEFSGLFKLKQLVEQFKDNGQNKNTL